ncbi:MAG: hypothetical protein LLG01_00490 [Planctomycetaceae bacterium]|nr:hypothetical protein [Planctomycetaceae bacterium]
MKIEVSAETFERLQRHSEPLVDTAESVIIKLLDSYEARKGAKMTIGTERQDDSRSDVPTKVAEPHDLRGFQKEVWELVIEPMPTKSFTLRDVYARETSLAKLRPHVKELRASIRGTLEKLRDRGLIEFIDNQGTYRKNR